MLEDRKEAVRLLCEARKEPGDACAFTGAYIDVFEHLPSIEEFRTFRECPSCRVSIIVPGPAGACIGVCPVIGEFIGDLIPRWEGEPLKRLLEYIPRLAYTRKDPKKQELRGWAVVDWLARENASEWLYLGGLKESADSLKNMPLLRPKTAKKCEKTLKAAYNAADNAAYNALEPSVKKLQDSALLLIERLLAI